MTVEVELLGNLHRFAGTQRVRLSIEGTTSCTVREILRRCGVPEGEVGIVAVDGRSVVLESVVADGSKLIIVPALHGG